MVSCPAKKISMFSWLGGGAALKLSQPTMRLPEGTPECSAPAFQHQTGPTAWANIIMMVMLLLSVQIAEALIVNSKTLGISNTGELPASLSLFIICKYSEV